MAKTTLLPPTGLAWTISIPHTQVHALAPTWPRPTFQFGLLKADNNWILNTQKWKLLKVRERNLKPKGEEQKRRENQEF